MYKCESRTIKKAECWRTDAFELWCWRRLLRVPWKARSNQSILKEINPEYALEGLMWSWSSNTWPPGENGWLIGKHPDVGKDWRQKEKRATEDEMVGWHHQFNRHELGKTPGDSEWQKPAVLQSMGSQSWTCLGDWTTTTCGEKGASYTIGRNVNWCSHYRK